MIQKREAARAVTKHGKYLRVTKENLNESETRAYNTIYSYFVDNYDIEPFVADQLALLKVHQLFYIMPKGDEADLVPTSEMMRKWVVEEKLTKKSKEKDTGTATVNLAVIVENLYNEKSD